MDKRKKPSIDGFVPRRSAGGVDPFSVSSDRKSFISKHPQGLQRTTPDGLEPAKREHQSVLTEAAPGNEAGVRRQLVSRTDVDESLQSIDQDGQLEPSKRSRKRDKKPRSKRRRIVKWVVVVIVAALILMGAWLLLKLVGAGGSVFNGDIFGIVQQKKLKEDSNGRSNVLIFGTSEDDPDHPGGLLTDSIMVLSINQEEKNAYMVSIPRDLYVKYGSACAEGYQGKINSLYACFADDGDNEKQGAEKLALKVGEVLGLDVQYYAHLNYTVVQDAVNAVGGVDVKIESNPKGVGILDRNFDWKCGYRCYYVKYDDGEIAHLDGEHALALARARNAAGGYGLLGGNFDREKNQQKIIKALRDKAVSAGTLTSLPKITALIDALGNNLRTSFDTSEIRTLISLGADIPSESIKSISLVDEDKPLVSTGQADGKSIVRPIAGLYDYGEIKKHVNKSLNSTAVSREAAQVVVLNASGVTGVAADEADYLEGLGMVIGEIGNVPEGKTYTKNVFYRVKQEGKSATLSALKKRYGEASLATGELPMNVTDDVDFVVVVYDPLIKKP